MRLESAVEELLRRNTPSRIKEKAKRTRLTVYARGLLAKWEQAQFAIIQMSVLLTSNAIRTAEDSSTSGENFTELQKMEFYNDCFWTFMYSCYEIVAQVVNQAESLGLSEEKVSFARVKKEMAQRNQDLKVSKELDNIQKSRVYKNIYKMRNSSEHRRPICLNETITTKTISRPYENASGPVNKRVVLLCDDPMSINPHFNKERSLVDYCTEILMKAERQLEIVLNKLLQ